MGKRQQAYRYEDVMDEKGLMPWVPLGARVRLPSGHIIVIDESHKGRPVKEDKKS